MGTRRVLGFVAEGAIRRQQQQQLHPLRPLRHVPFSPSATGARRAFSGQWRASALPSAPGVADRVRSVLRRMPQSVVVVTVAAPTSPSSSASRHNATEPHGQHQHAVGMTVSSFASLDLDGDVAAVAFNVRRPSRTLDAIERGAGVFNVHVLAGNDAGARIARHFTRPNEATAAAAADPGSDSSAADKDGKSWPMLRRKPRGLFDDLERRAGCGVAASASAGGGSGAAAPPMLKGPGVLYVLTCAVPSPAQGMMIPVMSHTIVVAGVTDVSAGEVAAVEDQEDRPLVSVEDAATKTSESQMTLGLSYGDRQYRAPGAILPSPGPVNEKGDE